MHTRDHKGTTKTNRNEIPRPWNSKNFYQTSQTTYFCCWPTHFTQQSITTFPTFSTNFSSFNNLVVLRSMAGQNFADLQASIVHLDWGTSTCVLLSRGKWNRYLKLGLCHWWSFYGLTVSHCSCGVQVDVK